MMLQSKNLGCRLLLIPNKVVKDLRRLSVVIFQLMLFICLSGCENNIEYQEAFEKGYNLPIFAKRYFELAEIYGYETKNFNRQVKNNSDRFEGADFRFQLTGDEIEELSRCKNFTSNWGGTRYLPYEFTELGIYMLMTVLRGNLAVKLSSALVMDFKAMRDYIVETQGLVTQRDILRLSLQTSKNACAY